jgi:Ala-tRNA(Pro) deacylase
MLIPERLRRFLDKNQIKHSILEHPESFSAQEMAHATHTHGRDVAKAVIIRDGVTYHMILVAADCLLDLGSLGADLGLENPELASEEEIADLFPDCELGAMPIFGNLYGLPVAIDQRLLPEEYIAFDAGNHHQAIRVHTTDFMRMVKPRIVGASVRM